MQKVRVPQNSFQFGEISDSLIMRTDSPVYTSSAQRVENMVVTAEGALKKRQGLKNHYDYSLTYNATYPEQSHLFKFEFDDNESYVISVEHEKVRCFFLDNAGTYTTAGGLHLVETITQDTSSNSLPFDQEYLQEYTFAQYGDVMFICHPLFAPRMLTRTSLTGFEISAYSFDQRADAKVTYQPYSTFQSGGVTLDPSATSGNGITLTTSADYWVPDHVGVIVRYHESEILITGYTSATVVTGNIIDTLKIRLSVLNPLRTADGSNLVEVTHLDHGLNVGDAITIEGASAVGGINTAQLNVTDQVREIIDENTYTYQAGGTANDSEDGGGNVKVVSHAPIRDWDEQSWSAVRGYPAAVTFHENRLSFGGTIAEPDNIWMSKIGNFFNFDVGEAADDDSIQIVAATGDVNQIRYMVSNRDLQIFTATGELYIPTYLNQAITPTNAQIRKQTPYGTEFVQPTSIDGATIFAEMGGRTVREYLYTDTEEAYTATSISTIASHLIDSPKYLTVVHSGFDLPDSYAAITLGNGDISLFSSNRAEKKASWTRVTTDGRFSSVVAIHNRLFANIWYNDKLQLCEFTGQLGADNYIEVNVPSSIPVIANSTFDIGPSAYGPSNQDTGKWYYNSTSPDTDLWHRFQMPDSNYIYRLNKQSSNSINDGTVFYKADFPMYKSNIYTFQYTLYTANAMGTGIADGFHDIRLRMYSGIFSRYTGSYKTSSDMTSTSTTFTEDVIVSHDISNPTILFQAKPTTDPVTLMIGLDNVTINGVAVNMNALSSGFVANETLASFENGSFAGNLTLDQNASVPVETYGGRTLTLGKKFTSKIVTNPVDASMGNGPATGEVRGITNVVVDVKDTDSLKINNRPVISSNFTGKKEVKLLGYNRNPQVTIEQDDPVDMQVNGLVAELIV
jgi:hypothetical protein